ncbi:MAG TPA: hypothetical protein VFE61_04190 [Candidatus Sulfotelmatobacter sp.]|nr:hypothetical protein [Candidatus Sulfotelmatobacter sp.]
MSQDADANFFIGKQSNGIADRVPHGPAAGHLLQLGWKLNALGDYDD